MVEAVLYLQCNSSGGGLLSAAGAIHDRMTDRDSPGWGIRRLLLDGSFGLRCRHRLSPSGSCEILNIELSNELPCADSHLPDFLFVATGKGNVMEPHRLDRRRELRYALAAGATVVRATVVRDKNGHMYHAKTENMSGAGVVLHFEEPIQFSVGDEVTCDFKVAHSVDKPLPYRGMGNVVRVEGCNVAVELHAGGISGENDLAPRSSEPPYE